MYKTLIVEKNDNLCKIKLNRPEVLNALSLELLQELQTALKDAQSDDDIRAVLITGEGRGFCSGADLGNTSIDTDIGATIEENYNPMARLIYNMPKPVIAAVNGIAAGAGMSLALACDMRILSTDAAFALGFTGIALVMDASGSYFLPKLVGRAKSLELAYTNRKVSAEEAINIGLGEVLFEAADFDRDSSLYAKQIALGPTSSFGMVKKQINESFNNNFEEQLALEAELQTIAASSADAAEGIAAFLQKRKPDFKGR